jgi:hypothetical protein
MKSSAGVMKLAAMILSAAWEAATTTYGLKFLATFFLSSFTY